MRTVTYTIDIIYINIIFIAKQGCSLHRVLLLFSQIVFSCLPLQSPPLSSPLLHFPPSPLSPTSARQGPTVSSCYFAQFHVKISPASLWWLPVDIIKNRGLCLRTLPASSKGVLSGGGSCSRWNVLVAGRVQTVDWWRAWQVDFHGLVMFTAGSPRGVVHAGLSLTQRTLKENAVRNISVNDITNMIVLQTILLDT